MEYLSELLKCVGAIVKLDQNTMLSLKDKFARMCVNLDITKPLPGSLIVSRVERCLRVPIIYEGLHEACSLCGGNFHQLETCPKLPITEKVEVFVEKFDASSVSKAQTPATSSHDPPLANESWVTVSPKKRVKAMIQARLKCNSLLDPKLDGDSNRNNEPSQLVIPENHNPAPLGPNDIILANALIMQHMEKQVVEGDPLDALNLGVKEEVNVDMYLNLQNTEDVEMSTDSAKRKRKEDREEATSRGPK